MKKTLFITAAAIIALAQLYVPASIILRHEQALAKGETFKFRTGLYDPHDPFRGRYVRLSFELSNLKNVPCDEPDKFTYQYREAYLTLSRDDDKFATVTSVQIQKPETGDYLKALVRQSYKHSDGEGRNWHVRIPFDRYFMNEEAAPEAERIYREKTVLERDEENNRIWSNAHYAEVKIHKGVAVLDTLFVDDQPIEALLAE